jgi:hypothetical protein
MAVTKFADVVQAARNYDALMVALSGTLPDTMRSYFHGMDWAFVGEGSDPSKAWRLPTTILARAKGQKAGEAELKSVAKSIAELKALSRKNIAYVWLESVDKLADFYKELKAVGITPERTAELTTPGSVYFELERYMFEIGERKNIAGLKAGDVDVVLLVGQGGLRGLEAPLQAYAGGEIHMYVTDSQSLTDVSLKQLMGRIDLGRVPTTSKTFFHFLDEDQSILQNKNYLSQMGAYLRQAADGKSVDGLRAESMRQLRKFSDEHMAGRRLPLNDEAAVMELLKKPELNDAKDFYRDYLMLSKLRRTLGDATLKRAAHDPALARRLLERPDVMEILVGKLRQIGEEQAIQSSGIRQKPKTSLPPPAPPAPLSP